MELLSFVCCSNEFVHSRPYVTFRNKRYSYAELLAPRPVHNLEDHPLQAVRDYLFNIFAGTLDICWQSSAMQQGAEECIQILSGKARRTETTRKT
jgi:hypothetical protein